MPKTTRTVGLVLLGLFVVFCSTLYHYADSTPASAPRPNWVDASLPQWAGAKRPYQIGRMSPLPMPIVPEPSADGTAAPSHDIATDAARAAKVGAAESAGGHALRVGRSAPDPGIGGAAVRGFTEHAKCGDHRGLSGRTN